eukprot:6396022-Pyramimonas_sp.AAC.1
MPLTMSTGPAAAAPGAVSPSQELPSAAQPTTPPGLHGLAVQAPPSHASQRAVPEEAQPAEWGIPPPTSVNVAHSPVPAEKA